MASTVAGWKQAAAAAATKAAAVVATVTVFQPTYRFRTARARHLRRSSAPEPSGGGPGAGGSALFRPTPLSGAAAAARVPPRPALCVGGGPKARAPRTAGDPDGGAVRHGEWGGGEGGAECITGRRLC